MECVSPRRKLSRDRDGGGDEDLELRVRALELLLHRKADRSRIDEVADEMETVQRWKESVDVRMAKLKVAMEELATQSENHVCSLSDVTVDMEMRWQEMMVKMQAGEESMDSVVVKMQAAETSRESRLAKTQETLQELMCQQHAQQASTEQCSQVAAALESRLATVQDNIKELTLQHHTEDSANRKNFALHEEQIRSLRDATRSGEPLDARVLKLQVALQQLALQQQAQDAVLHDLREGQNSTPACYTELRQMTSESPRSREKRSPRLDRVAEESCSRNMSPDCPQMILEDKIQSNMISCQHIADMEDMWEERVLDSDVIDVSGRGIFMI